jgi:hypothetical protein
MLLRPIQGARWNEANPGMLDLAAQLPAGALAPIALDADPAFTGTTTGAVASAPMWYRAAPLAVMAADPWTARMYEGGVHTADDPKKAAEVTCGPPRP